MIRAAVSVAAVLLLAAPAMSVLPLTQASLHRWQRLRSEHRVAPDSDQDAYFRQLRAYLPESGQIGFQHLGATDPGRILFFLQYSLAPRQVAGSTHPEFVIESGPPGGAGSLAFDPGFSLIATIGDDLRLFRRTGR